MRKVNNRSLGVTFLEILMLLALAAVIMIMSVRYYEHSRNNQQANDAISQMIAIVAAADNLARSSSNTYTGNVSTSAVEMLMPEHGMVTPWGTAITIVNATNQTFTVNFASTPAKICAIIKARLDTNPRFETSSTSCPKDGAVDFVYTYDGGQ